MKNEVHISYPVIFVPYYVATEELLDCPEEKIIS
jgi:hypothetical protein